MFKQMIMKKLLASKLKDVPEEQRDMLISAVEQNPELFTQIAEEIKQRVDSGEDQMAATMSVMQKHKDVLQQILKK